MKNQSWLDIYCDLVFKELTEMKKLGIKVPKKSFKMSKDKKIMTEYVDSTDISDCADLLISLGQI